MKNVMIMFKMISIKISDMMQWLAILVLNQDTRVYVSVLELTSFCLIQNTSYAFETQKNSFIKQK